MVYKCFLDDSKDQNQSKLMVSAGFFGTEDDWGSLRVAWRKVLKKHGLESFKSSEYYRLEGQFAKFKSDEYPKPKGREAAQTIRTELQTVMQQHNRIRGIGISVPLETYYRVYERPEAKGVLPGDPYQLALESVMYETAKIIKARTDHNAVAFIHDDADNFEVLRSAYRKFREANPTIAKVMGGFDPRYDKQHPPLQAADMIANYTLQLGLKGLESGDMKANVQEMRQSINLLGFWDEGIILSLLKQNLISKGKPIPVDLESDEYG